MSDKDKKTMKEIIEHLKSIESMLKLLVAFGEKGVFPLKAQCGNCRYYQSYQIGTKKSGLCLCKDNYRVTKRDRYIDSKPCHFFSWKEGG